MGFLDGFLSGVKDVATSTTRIVTDTAIDIGNVATGFQFNDDMEAAKQELTNAGILSAADAIEKNHFPFLKEMEKDIEEKLRVINQLRIDGEARENLRDERFFVLEKMIADAQLLAQMSTEAQQLMERASRIPGFQRWAQMLDIDVDLVPANNGTIERWNQVAEAIVTTRLGVDLGAGGLAVGAVGIAGLSGASKLLSGTKMAKLSSHLGKGSKFLKIGKLAGRASAVLSVVTVGLDIGLSVVELEARKAELEEQTSLINSGLAEARADLNALSAEIQAINQRIGQMLNSVNPPLSESSWDGWVAAMRGRLTKLREDLISVDGIRKKAVELSKATVGQPIQQRIGLIRSLDPRISEEEAREIIASLENDSTPPAPIDQAGIQVHDPVALGVQTVWLAGEQRLPATISFDVTCHRQSDEFIPCFSKTKAPFGSPQADGLTWYLSPHRDDFTFRTQVFGGFPQIDRLAPGFKPAVGQTNAVTCRISPTSAVYTVNGREYARATFPLGTIPSSGFFGFIAFNPVQIDIRNIVVTPL